MALIEEVWGDLTPSSPPPPSTPQVVQQKKEVKEGFVSGSDSNPVTPIILDEPVVVTPIKHKKGSGLPLFLALLVTGGCAIYALDLFTSTIAGSAVRRRR